MSLKPIQVNIGQKFGRLTVIEEADRYRSKKTNYSARMFLCVCDCGKVSTIYLASLRSGQVSCGCFTKEVVTKNRTKHGMVYTDIYGVWKGIKARCLNSKNAAYKDYGGRGIKICEEWKEFINFYKDMSSTYKKGLSIDRINNEGSYCKENCRWATNKEQANNTRKSIIIEYEGKKYPISDLAKKFNICRSTLFNRYFKKKMPLEEALVKKIIS